MSGPGEQASDLGGIPADGGCQQIIGPDRQVRGEQLPEVRFEGLEQETVRQGNSVPPGCGVKREIRVPELGSGQGWQVGEPRGRQPGGPIAGGLLVEQGCGYEVAHCSQFRMVVDE